MITQDFGDVLHDLDESIRWLQGLGVELDANGRFGVYRDRISRLLEFLRDWKASPEESILDGWFSALFEVRELDLIRKGLQSLGTVQGLAARAARIVQGPADLSEEHSVPQGNQSRDAAFELVLASKLQLAGYTPDLGQRGDAVFTIGDQRVIAECKRPRSTDAIQGALEAARTQALNDTNGLAAQRNSGLIVLDLSYALALSGHLLSAPGDLEAELTRYRQRLAANIGMLMASKRLWNQRILAVIFRISALIASRGLPLHVQDWTMIVNTEVGATPERIHLANQLGDDLT